MPSPLKIEQLTWLALTIVLVVAIALGRIDRGRATDKGFSLLTIGGFLVVVAWASLALNWHQGWGEYYFRYGRLGALPIFIFFGYCLGESIFWDWQVLLLGLVAVIILSFTGFIFWPLWLLGFLISLRHRSRD